MRMCPDKDRRAAPRWNAGKCQFKEQINCHRDRPAYHLIASVKLHHVNFCGVKRQKRHAICGFELQRCNRILHHARKPDQQLRSGCSCFPDTLHSDVLQELCVKKISCRLRRICRGLMRRPTDQHGANRAEQSTGANIRITRSIFCSRMSTSIISVSLSPG